MCGGACRTYLLSFAALRFLEQHLYFSRVRGRQGEHLAPVRRRSPHLPASVESRFLAEKGNYVVRSAFTYPDLWQQRLELAQALGAGQRLSEDLYNNRCIGSMRRGDQHAKELFAKNSRRFMISVAAVALLIVASLLVLAALSATKRVSRRRFRQVLILAALGVLLLFCHPWLLGLPGRVAEMRFAGNLRHGMTRGEIIRLAVKYGGTGPFSTDLEQNDPTYDWRSNGDLEVWFTDHLTLCISGGKAFSFYFDRNWTLLEWKVQGWGTAC